MPKSKEKLDPLDLRVIITNNRREINYEQVRSICYHTA